VEHRVGLTRPAYSAARVVDGCQRLLSGSRMTLERTDEVVLDTAEDRAVFRVLR
jgi:hypothetical protein